MVKWVFFDVGNVLFNDDQQAYFAYRFIHQEIQRHKPRYSFATMLQERESHAHQGDNWILRLIAQQWLPEDRIEPAFAELSRLLKPLYDEFHLLNPGLNETLGELTTRKYQLGIIANQTHECRQSLQRRDLVKWFDVIAISEELDLHKPDVEFYRWAVEKAGCRPEESVMIGDRKDNDIAPAQAVGMKTIFLDWEHYDRKLWQPKDTLSRLFIASCQRVPLFGNASHALHIHADRVVGALTDIPQALEGL